MSLFDRMHALLKNSVVHPYLFGLFFVLYNIHQLENYVSVKEWSISIVVLITGILILHYILRWFLKEPINRGLILSTVLIMFLFYSDIYYAFWSTEIHRPVIRHRYLILILLAILFLISYYLKKNKAAFRWNHYLNVLSVVLVLYQFGTITYLGSKGPQWKGLIELSDKAANSSVKSKASKELPDIYLLLVDGYTSNESLSKFWSFDNSDFVKELSQRGFYVTENGNSNYNETLFTMASMLNMDYLPSLEGVNDPITRNTISRVWIKRSEVVRQLYLNGYELINYSLFDIEDQPFYIDYNYLEVHGLDFYSHLIKKTVSGRMYSDTYWQTLSLTRGRDVLELASAHSTDPGKQPRFIYAHLTIPHLPYFFDSDGKLYEDGNGKYPDDQEKSYLEQLVYTNQQVLLNVDKILENAKSSSVIIVTGDHGYRYLEGPGSEEEAYTTFRAVYFPNKDYSELARTKTPVNLFRVVLNVYLEADYALLEEKKAYFIPLNK
ncbi:MAG: sulfatase-like hydrolase/transferase [Bacteroidetes bacterium]|nr:sulfatase-like hydrolase/transferase [Bacteroidota bacterium]